MANHREWQSVRELTPMTLYQLKAGMTRVVRAGLILEAPNTVELTDAEAAQHADVLDPAPGDA